MAIEASMFCHLLLDILPFIQCFFLSSILADGVHSSFWDKRAVKGYQNRYYLSFCHPERSRGISRLVK